MNRADLYAHIKEKQSYLCVGLDTDIQKIPKHLLEKEDPIWEFNKQIIDATGDLCVAYKLNTAFYESLGAKGWTSLQKTVEYIADDIFKIADAKRGDIGNSSQLYARAFFETLNFDAVTLSPYMGADAIIPFLKYPDKWAIIFALTSNKSSRDFQFMRENDEPLYEKVIKKAKAWGNPDNMMFVVGATQAGALASIRTIAPEHFLLIPGVGAQGGTLKEVSKYGFNDHCGLLINSSRNIIYAGNDKNFAAKARLEAEKLQQEMAVLL